MKGRDGNAVVLVYPRPSLESPARGPALSIFCLGAVLERNGWDVSYVDERFDAPGRLRTVLEEKRPFAVGVSSMTGYQLTGAGKALRTAREFDGDIVTIFGGPHATIQCAKVMEENGDIDYWVAGEGEIALLNLLTDLRNGKKPEIREAQPDLDALGIPITPGILPYYKVANEYGALRLVTTRGCMFACNFCYNQRVYGGRWRAMSVEAMERGLAELTKHMKITHVMLGDDNVGGDRKRIEEIGDMLHRYGIKWHTSLMPQFCSESMLRLMEERGCDSLLIGAESGSDRILKDIINKKLPRGVETLKEAARNIAKTSISALYSFITSIPTETEEERLRSMDLADWIKETDPKARLGFYVYTPYPGTKMYQMALEAGFVEPKSFEEWSRVTMSECWGPFYEKLYYVAGLHFRKDKTALNFPGEEYHRIEPYIKLADECWAKRDWKDFPHEEVKAMLVEKIDGGK